MKKLLFQSGVLLLLLALMSTGHTQNTRYIPVFCDQGHSLQDKVDKATEGATLDVYGTCNEAVVIRTDRISIGAFFGQATFINPPAESVAFTILADDVEISNLNITGGTSAVLITQGSSATITNNQILNYTRDGISIVGSSDGSIQDNFLSSTNANNSAIFLAGSSALIEDNTIGASSASGILIAATSSALVGCNNISVSHPFFAGIHVSLTSEASLGACPNTISNSDPVGRAIFCSKSSSIFAEAAQIITAGAIDLDPNCEVLAIPGVTFPPLPLSKTLVLKIDFTNEIFNAGSTATLEKGVRTYQEFPLLDDQGALIGEYRFHGVSTLPAAAAAAGWYANEAFEIFGEGVIEGISQADMSVSLFPEGSIIGGTGRFSGASGEYTASADLTTYTFTFKKRR